MNPQLKQGGAVNFRVFIGLAVILVCIIVVAYFFYSLQPNNILKTEKEFKIAKGEGFKEIGARLSQESIVKSLTVFKVYALLTGKAQRFQPGTYVLSDTMSVPQIVSVFTVKGRSDVLVTIPEGSTLADIDLILTDSKIIEKGTVKNFQIKNLVSDYSFLNNISSLEGFLFPDSYYFELNSPPEKVVRRMLDVFSERAWPLLSGQKNWYETLILSSFLEREVPEFEDRQIVAGILLRRISIKMPLQVDATIGYAKCDGQVRGCENLLVTRSDLRIASPYNTYERIGWPPTPISNPGESAIRAALSPQKTQYLYYLSSSKTKETLFSKTLEEHNIKRAKYL